MKRSHEILALTILTLGLTLGGLTCVAGCASKQPAATAGAERLLLEPGGHKVVKVKRGINAILLDNESFGEVRVQVVDRRDAIQGLIVDGRETLAIRADETKELRFQNTGAGRINLRITMKEQTPDQLGWSNVW